MTYHLNAYDMMGIHLAGFGPFQTIDAARQAMMEHSQTGGLPTEPPFFAPECGVIEGWFVGETEYAIQVAI